MEYVECLLRKGKKRERRYIPKNKAIVGKFFKIREENGQWSENWDIILVGSKIIKKEVQPEEEKEGIFRSLKKFLK